MKKYWCAVLNASGFLVTELAYSQSLPSPSLVVDFDQASLDRLGALYPSGRGFSLVEGRNGRPAVQFYGIQQPSVIQIPNRDAIKFKEGASFDMWVKVDGGEGMDGFGNLNTKFWGASMIAKSHDRNGFGLNSFVQTESSIASSGPTFHVFDQTWSTLACDYSDKLARVTVGTWFRFTATVSPKAGMHMYVNQKVVMSCLNARPSFSASNQQDLFIGRYKDKWYPFNGLIQDLRIYKVALSEEQVQDLP